MGCFGKCRHYYRKKSAGFWLAQEARFPLGCVRGCTFMQVLRDVRGCVCLQWVSRCRLYTMIFHLSPTLCCRLWNKHLLPNLPLAGRFNGLSVVWPRQSGGSGDSCTVQLVPVSPGEVAGEQSLYKRMETGVFCTQGTECSVRFHTLEYRKIFKPITPEKLQIILLSFQSWAGVF